MQPVRAPDRRGGEEATDQECPARLTAKVGQGQASTAWGKVFGEADPQEFDDATHIDRSERFLSGWR